MNDEYVAYIPDALEMVSAWEVSEEEFARAVNEQARLMCGMGLEPITEQHPYPSYASLRF